MSDNTPYRIFTMAHDEVIRSADVSQIPQYGSTPIDTSNAVMEKLEHGMLPYRLPAHLVEQLHLKILKRLSDQKITPSDFSSLILVDHSASMRGFPISVSSAVSSLIGAALEMTGARNEAIGYTTASWNGGKAHQDWVDAGCPDNPGRVSVIRYIIYKDSTQTWADPVVTKNMLLMTREGILKEGIDGEALLWGEQRLKASKAGVTSTILINDATPADIKTDKLNPPGTSETRNSYTTVHYRRVIERMRKRAVSNLAFLSFHGNRQYRNHLSLYDLYRQGRISQALDEIAEAVVPDNMKHRGRNHIKARLG